MQVSTKDYRRALDSVARHATDKYESLPVGPVHPSQDILDRAASQIRKSLPTQGLQLEETIQHLIRDICPGLSASPSPRYYGFVTGGSTPAAQLADFIGTINDQNVQVHLPKCSVSTTVEDAALRLVLELLNLDANQWSGRTLTTGATASNLLGLACGRNHALESLGVNVGEDGFGGKSVQVYCAAAHASIKKAASIVGIGRANCREIANANDDYGVAFDVDKLESQLALNKKEGIGSIIVISLGEVNTGLSTPHVDRIKVLAQRYDAWIHADAAFAIFAGICTPLSALLDDLQFADSICVDGHKWLSVITTFSPANFVNELDVPYDTAMFFTRHKTVLKDVCASGPAAYLTSAAIGDNDIESPLNVGIENSRRFRALPLYATLVAYGREGYELMIQRNLEFARTIDAWLRQTNFFEVLTPKPAVQIGQYLGQGQYETTNIVLFALSAGNEARFKMPDIVQAINETNVLYITGTVFRGRSAARIAVSNWRTGLRRSGPATTNHDLDDNSNEDFELVTKAIAQVISDLKASVT